MDNTFDYYFWIDAGCSRFFKNSPREIYPLIENISEGKFNIQGNVNTDKIYPSMDIEKYKFDNNCILVGTFFGGNKKIIKILSKEIEKILITDMIEKNMIHLFPYFIKNACAPFRQVTFLKSPNSAEPRIERYGRTGHHIRT